MTLKTNLFKSVLGAVGLSGAALLFSQKPPAPTPTPSASRVVSKRLDSEQLLRDLKILSSAAMEGRASGSRGAMKARQYLLQRFKESRLTPIKTDFFQWFSMPTRGGKQIRGVNVVGQIRGKKYPDKYIAVTAHYDHLGIRGGQIYNGADDNASGVAALLSLANYFRVHAPNHSLVFVAFDGEEIGLLGSQYFVSHLPINKNQLVLNINMDMISRSDKGEIYATGTYQNPLLKPVLEGVKKQSLITLLFGHDDPKTGGENWTAQSDQGSFHDAGIPFIYFGVEDHEDYHQPTDDFDKIVPKFYVGATETVLLAVEAFDKSLK